MGEVAEVVGGGTPRTENANNFGGDIPWITPADLSGYRDKFIANGARNITQAGLENSGARLMPAGSVLFSSRAPIGYVAVAANAVSTNQGFKSFVLRDGLTSDYAYYYLQRAKQLAVELASGTTFLEISGKKAAQIPIPIAPIDEQHRIVAEIEKQFTRLEAGVAGLRRVQASLKRYRAAVLKAACEGKLVPTEAELARQRPNEKVAAASRRWSAEENQRRDASATISENSIAEENQSRDGSATLEDSHETGAQLLERILTERRQKWNGKGK
jgi:type I restriction enzyme S subunit